MSVGPLGGMAGSVAGTPLAQTKGSDVERAEQDIANQQRTTRADQKAESAAGVGEADGEDHETADRDADGRRIWEEAPTPKDDETENAGDEQPHCKDASGQSGNLLDLTG